MRRKIDHRALDGGLTFILVIALIASAGAYRSAAPAPSDGAPPAWKMMGARP